ncbi:MAG: cell envelope integrity protein TolA [Betaproteobacteria bacterium]
MNASADWLAFAPPKARGFGRAFALAIIAHLVLLAALTLGVQWKRDAPTTTVEAELWSAIPKAAAPKLVEAPPPPPPAPAPKPVPVPPAPVAKAPDADIALQQEKKRLEQEKRLAAQQLEQQKLAQEKHIQEKKLALEKKREQELKLAQEKKKREDEARRLEEEDKKRQLAQTAKQEALKAQQQAALDKQESIKLEILRKDNLQRMAGLAGATGGAASAGTALRASGPSGSYGSRVSAIVKPNIVFIEDTPDNPQALVEVRVAPDGTIVGRKLKKSSGNKAWDEAVLKAIDKTAVLPRDIDGTVPPLLDINFRRRD